MRYISALYDAPMPAGLALRNLRAAGFEDRDLALLPNLPGRPPVHGFLAAEVREQGDPVHALAKLGLPEPTLELVREGLRRGAILVLVRCPDLSAPAALRALDGAGPLSGERLGMDSRMAPGRVYRWSEFAMPDLVVAGEDASGDGEPRAGVDSRHRGQSVQVTEDTSATS